MAETHITAIRPLARDADRVAVRVGRRTVATLSIKQVAELGLAVGQAYDDALASRLADAEAYDKALRDAMSRLNRKPLSRRQLDTKLRDNGHDADTRRNVLDRLEELNLLDDEAFGRVIIRNLLTRRAAGPRLLQQKLYDKGLDRAVIDRLIAETVTTEDQADQAVTFARKKLASLQRHDPATRRRRLYGALARRGYTPDTISAAMSALRHDIGQSAIDD